MTQQLWFPEKLLVCAAMALFFVTRFQAAQWEQALLRAAR